MTALKLAVALPFLAAPPAAAQVLIEGTVINVDSLRLAGARIEIVDPAGQSAAQAVTDSLGRFLLRLPRLRSGSYTLSAEMLGYRTTRAVLPVTNLQAVELLLIMDVAAIPVEPLRVSARRRYGGARAEFYERADRVRRMGGAIIIDYEELQRTPNLMAEQIIAARIPLARQCPPVYYIDGVQAMPADLALLTATSLEGIEIHRTELHLPPMYHSSQGCTVVLFWTQVGDHGKGSPLTWRRVLIAAGLLAAGVLLLQ